jgi:cell division protein FtsL
MEWIAFASAAVTALLSFAGVYVANKKQTALMDYRLKELEKKVDKHNQVIERTFKLEQQVSDLEKRVS